MLYLLLFAAMILTLVAQFKVKNNFEKYSKIAGSSGMTGAQVARMILERKGIHDVSIQAVRGVLTDHYDPMSKTVRLSEAVYDQNSLSAISVAAHEVGHAMQHDEEYSFLKFRSLLAPVAAFTSRFIFVLIFIGFLFEIMQLVDLAIVFFAIVVLFHVITLPVEFNASRRALESLEDYSILSSNEIPFSKKVLSSAALTYVASASVAMINLLRLISLRGNRE